MRENGRKTFVLGSFTHITSLENATFHEKKSRIACKVNECIDKGTFPFLLLLFSVKFDTVLNSRENVIVLIQILIKISAQLLSRILGLK